MTKILIVDDDPQLLRQLGDWLKSENYVIDAVSTGQDALQLLDSYSFDVVLLDWGLPDIAGLEVLRRYRSSGGKVPIIFLTGKGDITDKESGLNSGADDYLVKPFEVRELAARIGSILRRPPDILPVELRIDKLSLEPRTRTLRADDISIRLMPKECALLEFLMRHPDRPFSSRALLDAVWSAESDTTEDTVRTNIKTLRQKLKHFGQEDLLKTVLGAGYMLESKLHN